MKFLILTVCVCLFARCQTGVVTDLSPPSNNDDSEKNQTDNKISVDQSDHKTDGDDDEVMIETVPKDTFIPANIFDPSLPALNDQEKQDEPWGSDGNPIFRALRDFIFQSGEELFDDPTQSPVDPTEEIVKLLEKGLIEATTMFLAPSDDESLSTSSSVENAPEPIKVMKIEDDSFEHRMGEIAAVSAPSRRSDGFTTVANVTAACTNCYTTLHTCVQQCFVKQNCNNLQRQARMCPSVPPRICNFFSNWSPMEECKSDDDCQSPLLCCNDGCINKCSEGVWKN